MMIENENKQIILEEQLILVDEKDNIVGYDGKGNCHQKEGLLHRAFSIFIFNNQAQLLIQKRSKNKLLWPLYWSNSVCGHPRRDEDYENAIMRRLKEELGIVTQLHRLFHFKYHEVFNNIGSENELCSVFIGKTGKEIQPNREEIDEWKYVTISELNEDILKYSHLYTPWFKIEWELMKTRYNNQMNDLMRAI
jgi:isopentenyl-diphosphate delta-isomerase